MTRNWRTPFHIKFSIFIQLKKFNRKFLINQINLTQPTNKKKTSKQKKKIN